MRLGTATEWLGGCLIPPGRRREPRPRAGRTLATGVRDGGLSPWGPEGSLGGSPESHAGAYQAEAGEVFGDTAVPAVPGRSCALPTLGLVLETWLRAGAALLHPKESLKRAKKQYQLCKNANKAAGPNHSPNPASTA